MRTPAVRGSNPGASDPACRDETFAWCVDADARGGGSGWCRNAQIDAASAR
jgi:hypothetical protein